jgi:hypothetical protein
MAFMDESPPPEPCFRQFDDAWWVEGPAEVLRPGRVVEVTKRSGEVSHVVVLEVEEQGDGVALASFAYPARWVRVERDDDEKPDWLVAVPDELAAVAESGEPVPVVRRNGSVQHVVVASPLTGPDERGNWLGRPVRSGGAERIPRRLPGRPRSRRSAPHEPPSEAHERKEQQWAT